MNETSYYIIPGVNGTKQIMHHGRVYGLVEYSKDVDESSLLSCTLQIVYSVMMPFCDMHMTIFFPRFSPIIFIHKLYQDYQEE